MVVLGYILLVVAAGWFLYKLYVAYSSAGGTDFMLPIYDAAMYPPMLVSVGLWLVLRHYEIHWPIWIYIAIWLGATGLAAGSLKVLEELGDRSL